MPIRIVFFVNFAGALSVLLSPASAELDRFMPRKGETTEIWRATNEPATRYSVNYHNAQCWSHRGRYICYSGKGHVFIYDLHNDREIEVDRGSSPRWAWKHDWLFYIRDRSEVMWFDADMSRRVRLAGGAAAQLGGTDSEDQWLFGGRSTGGRQGMQGFRIAIRPSSKFEKLEGLVGIQWIPNPAHPVIFVRWDYYDDPRRDVWGRFLLSLPTRKWFNLEGGDVRTGSPQIQRCHQSWSGDGTYYLHGGMPMRGRRWDEPYPSNLHCLAAIGCGDISPCGHSGRWIHGSSSYGPMQIADLRSGDGWHHLEAALSQIHDSRSYSFSASSGKHDNDAKGSGDGTKVAFHSTYDLKDGPVARITGSASRDSIAVESTDGFPDKGALSLPNNRVIGYERKTANSFEGLTQGLHDTRRGIPGRGTIVSSFEARLIPEDQRNPSLIPPKFRQASFADRNSPLIWQRQCDVYIAVVRSTDRPYLQQVGEAVQLIPGENHWETFGYYILRDGNNLTDEPLRPGTEYSLPGPGSYAGAPICSPSRAALLTGRYPHAVGVPELCSPSQRGSVPVLHLSLDATTIPEALGEHGYRSMLAGKWHLGYAPESWPRRHGFDEFWGSLAGTPKYFEPVYTYHNEEEISVDGYYTDRITEKAVEFINEQSPAKPFFLYLAYNAPHYPLEAPSDLIEKYNNVFDDEKFAIYAGMVERMDTGIGHVLKMLDKKGFARNTLVVFTSDNGPSPEPPAYGLKGARRSAGPLKGHKFSVHEGGIRVPFLARWPGTLSFRFRTLPHFTVQQARRFPVRNVQAASRIWRGEMDGGATVGGPRVG